MNLPEHSRLELTDAGLRRALRNWAAMQTPPIGVRARLLVAAARPVVRADQLPAHRTPTLPQQMLAWAWVYSMERGIASLRLVS